MLVHQLVNSASVDLDLWSTVHALAETRAILRDLARKQRLVHNPVNLKVLIHPTIMKIVCS